ncbi:hypothetical protein RS82_00067 [Microbacterium trichothecenolyticum]|uniref:Cyanobacterial TRADD-N associated 2 transmembrane domain-containing protein n=1 Tax=Microbacterium trichothecenolyticum TaxID=69370 RepID=A0A0M2HMQ8_MICTR|nr:hypothetical protein RS82_00067 [Microbacterium trichothecenolyticum]
MPPSSAGSSIDLVAASDEQAWQESEERKKAISSRNKWALIAIPLAIVGVGIVVWWFVDPTVNYWLSYLGWLLGGWGIGASVTLPFAVSSRKRAYLQRRKDLRESAEIIGGLTEASSIPTMADLLQLNRREMQKYHDLTTEQATVSFRHSQRAMIGGFIVVVGCIIIVTIPAIPTETKLIVGSVGVISTILSGYITNTFLKSHAASVAQLNRFFTQPLISSYLLTAERVALQLEPSERTPALQLVVAQALRSAGSESIALGAIYEESTRRGHKSDNRNGGESSAPSQVGIAVPGAATP